MRRARRCGSRFRACSPPVLREQFEDPEAGGFYFTGRDHEQLIHRPKPGHDNATPSGNGVAVFALQRLAALTGEDRYRHPVRNGGAAAGAGQARG